MATRADVLARARGWLGTPFHHQGRVRGVGCDCAGLLIGVARDLGLAVEDVTGYPRTPDGHSLRGHLGRLAVPVPAGRARPGDILLMRIGRHPRHLGLLCPGRTIIHAWSTAGGVVETRLSERWLARIVGFYRFPGIED